MRLIRAAVGSVGVVLRWTLRLLAVVAAVGVLTVHGVSAEGAAEHTVVPSVAAGAAGAATGAHHGMAAGPTSDSAPDHEDRTIPHWHHLLVACIAVLAAAVAVRARHRVASILGATATKVVSAVRSHDDLADRAPPPAWLRLGVILR